MDLKPIFAGEEEESRVNKINKVFLIGLIVLISGCDRLFNAPIIDKPPVMISARSDLTEAEIKAIRTAEEVCREEGWEWKGVGIGEGSNYKGRKVWIICTHLQREGGNASVYIDKTTGEVVGKFFNRE